MPQHSDTVAKAVNTNIVEGGNCCIAIFNELHASQISFITIRGKQHNYLKIKN